MLMAGCGGEYILSVPDQLAADNDTVTVVSRLQRSEFWTLNMPVRQAALRFRVDDGVEQAAASDELGYAAVQLAVPQKVGVYKVVVSHQDYEGEEVQRTVPFYVWNPQRKVVAVDLDSLPPRQIRQESAPVASSRWVAWMQRFTASLVPEIIPRDDASARRALQGLSKQANILYLTRSEIEQHDACRKALKDNGYPAGPILTWRRQRWHVVPGPYRIPKICVESRLVSQLSTLRETFKNLETGICDSKLAAKAFTEAGMTAWTVGGGSTWKELAEKYDPQPASPDQTASSQPAKK